MTLNESCLEACLVAKDAQIEQITKECIEQMQEIARLRCDGRGLSR